MSSGSIVVFHSVAVLTYKPEGVHERPIALAGRALKVEWPPSKLATFGQSSMVLVPSRLCTPKTSRHSDRLGSKTGIVPSSCRTSFLAAICHMSTGRLITHTRTISRFIHTALGQGRNVRAVAPKVKTVSASGNCFFFRARIADATRSVEPVARNNPIPSQD